jgi:hypothetical protein
VKNYYCLGFQIDFCVEGGVVEASFLVIILFENLVKILMSLARQIQHSFLLILVSACDSSLQQNNAYRIKQCYQQSEHTDLLL